MADKPLGREESQAAPPRVGDTVAAILGGRVVRCTVRQVEWMLVERVGLMIGPAGHPIRRTIYGGGITVVAQDRSGVWLTVAIGWVPPDEAAVWSGVVVP